MFLRLGDDVWNLCKGNRSIKDWSVCVMWLSSFVYWPAWCRLPREKLYGWTELMHSPGQRIVWCKIFRFNFYALLALLSWGVRVTWVRWTNVLLYFFNYLTWYVHLFGNIIIMWYCYLYITGSSGAHVHEGSAARIFVHREELRIPYAKAWYSTIHAKAPKIATAQRKQIYITWKIQTRDWFFFGGIA